MNRNPLAHINILAIDDEEFARSFLGRVLEKLGVAGVVTAENGAEALVKLDTADPRIDLVICDIEMPEMDGFEFVRKVRYGAVKGYKDVPIIMLTGKDTDRNVRKGRIHKIEAFVVKPPEVDSLRGYICRALGI